MQLEQIRYVPWAKAVADGYNAIHLLSIQTIRQQHVLADFPGRTAAHLYL
jgi:hypothetical protein